MKKLTIKTTRIFKDNNEWNDYKQQISHHMSTDWEKLEKTGFVDFTQHHKDEMVITRLELEEI